VSGVKTPRIRPSESNPFPPVEETGGGETRVLKF